MEDDKKMLVLPSLILCGFLLLISKLYDQFILKPSRIRQILQKQGIRGPSPSSFMYGNISEIKKISQQSRSTNETGFDRIDRLSHDWPSSVFPHVLQWRNEYGPTFMYSTGQLQILCITDAEMVKELSLYTNLNLGKPSYLSKDRGPLLGEGILSSSGLYWAHQRKIIAPEFYIDKVKDMVNLMVESTTNMIQTWKSKMNDDKEYTGVRVDEDLRRLSADMISRACFGSNYAQGETIFAKFRDLQKAMSKSSVGVPGSRYVPSRNNREIWRLEKEINSNILKVVKERSEGSTEKDLLQSILEAAKSYGENGDSPFRITPQKFIVDNCKSIYFAGHETTATAAAWCLVMLAANPEWQDRARAEVLEVCGGKTLNADMLRKMKTLTMVIQETLRLYSPVANMIRETQEDISFKHIRIPKGVNIQIIKSLLHHDPDLWGPDATEFNPERFSAGSTGGCRIPQAYIPFGAGTRICAGQHFAMAELKVILSLILSNFSFKLSPEYRHSPAFRLTVEPGYGVFLLVKKV